jgi:hypothetical protein
MHVCRTHGTVATEAGMFAAKLHILRWLQVQGQPAATSGTQPV